jgi:mRNA-degrading endonuclease toxin of MazEF toxin-antitoxin module
VILTEQVRTVSHQRLLRRRGIVSEETLRKIEPRLRYFLEL